MLSYDEHQMLRVYNLVVFVLNFWCIDVLRPFTATETDVLFNFCSEYTLHYEPQLTLQESVFSIFLKKSVCMFHNRALYLRSSWKNECIPVAGQWACG